jgi:hypothetical protein
LLRDSEEEEEEEEEFFFFFWPDFSAIFLGISFRDTCLALWFVGYCR